MIPKSGNRFPEKIMLRQKAYFLALATSAAVTAGAALPQALRM
jgi:hypothetical protein